MADDEIKISSSQQKLIVWLFRYSGPVEIAGLSDEQARLIEPLDGHVHRTERIGEHIHSRTRPSWQRANSERLGYSGCHISWSVPARIAGFIVGTNEGAKRYPWLINRGQLT